MRSRDSLNSADAINTELKFFFGNIKKLQKADSNEVQGGENSKLTW